MSSFFRLIGTVASIVAVIPSPIQPIAAAVAVGASIGAAVTAKRPANDQQGRQLQFKVGADMPIPFVMGRTAVGGSVVYRDTYGTEAASAASRSASNAAASETVATQKASAASGSADTASTRAGQASASADRAALSETGAAGSASQAGRSEGLAATSARQAGDSATAASGSASLATSKATEAGTKATAASTSADRAETKAGAADASASRAAASETNAAGSASSAATSQQVTATTADEATRVLAAQFPRAINAGAFTPDASRATDRAAMPAGSVVDGRIRQAPGISPQPYVVFLRSPMPHVPGTRRIDAVEQRVELLRAIDTRTARIEAKLEILAPAKGHRP